MENIWEEKIPESSKKQNLNLLQAIKQNLNLQSIYNLSCIISNLEMI